MSKFITQFTRPDKTLTFAAYGPKTDEAAKATRFSSSQAATHAGQNTLWGDPRAFWESERRHSEITKREHRGWTFQVIEVPE